MPATTFPVPVQQFFTQIDQIRRPAHFRALLHNAGRRFLPGKPAREFEPQITRRQSELLVQGVAGQHQLSTIRSYAGKGPTPTIVLGGFVPDSDESVFLLRDLLRKQGNLYCMNYSRQGFHMDLLFAQLDDLVDEIAIYQQRKPVIFCVSYGCGLVMEWLRRRRVLGGHALIAGVVLVSPVACAEDLLPAGRGKPATLLGRALQPFMDGSNPVDQRVIERSRTIFTKMFESGAQNKGALSVLMSAAEVEGLKRRVMGAIRGIDLAGACERVRSLCTLPSPRSYFDPALLPLCEEPALILYAEKEDSVLDPASPTRFVLETAHRAYFPRGRCHVVTNPGGSAVQHASLIFHHANFRPALASYYASLRGGWLRRAA